MPPHHNVHNGPQWLSGRFQGLPGRLHSVIPFRNDIKEMLAMPMVWNRNSGKKEWSEFPD
jgi:hypothetical protein